jgi:hypothetical protein
MKTENKFKQGNKKAITCYLLFVTCYLFSGCGNLLTMPRAAPVEQAYGTVTVSFAGGEARTVFPNTVFASCDYTFYNQSNGQAQVKTPGPGGSFALAPGSWSVEVQAYGDPEAPDALAATGASEAFAVYAGQNRAVMVTLAGIPETGAGTFKYRIRYPPNTTARDFSIVKLPDMTPLSFSVPAGGGTEMSGAVNNVPAGFYLVTVRLLHPDGIKGAGKNQVVHIYNALTSEFGTEEDPVVFVEEDFAFLPLPAPSAPIVTMAGTDRLEVSWTGITGASAYEVWFSPSPDLGSAEKWGDATGSSAAISGLAAPTYYVWIRGKNDLGPGDFSPATRGLFVKSIVTAADLAKIGVDPAWPLTANYALDADITLENWVPLGAGGAFSGSFDGKGRTITVKSFAADFVAANSNLGIFANVGGSAAEKALIENLTVHGELQYTLANNRNYAVGILAGQALPYALCSNITVTGSLAFSNDRLVSAGGVAGVLNGGEATGCVVNATITVSGSGAGGSYTYVGGVAGRYEGGASITECRSAGNISGSTTGANVLAGGIAGGTLHPWSGGDTTAYYGKIENCSSSGVISASGGFYWPIAGGIVGQINGDGTRTPGAGRTRVVNCYATGTVQAEGPAGSWPYLGGIVGQNQSAGLVSRCYFTGTVRALGDSINDYTGGIAGYNAGGGIVEDCWSAGSVNGRINGGGIVGQNQSNSSLRRCYSAAAITLRGLAGERGSAAGDGAGGIAGYNQSQAPDALTACAALNPSIATAGYERVHRIDGAVSGNEFGAGSGSQTNNLAWEGMAMTVNSVVVAPDDVGLNGRDGQSIVQKPEQAVYTALGWDFVNTWTMGGDGYPILQWQ